MRYVRFFILNFQHTLNYKSRIFVYFLITLINPLIVLLFWVSAFKSDTSLGNWTLPTLTTYYLLLTIFRAMLESHIEDDVAHVDIGRGDLVKYLIRPLSYYEHLFFREFTWRLVQALMGGLIFLGIYSLFNSYIPLSLMFVNILLAVLSGVLGFLICHTYKMILGFTAFWVTNFSGLKQLSEVTLLIFAGSIIPIDLFPNWLEKISALLPFQYMIYVPLKIFIGDYSFIEITNKLSYQLLWLLIMIVMYKFIFKKGLKIFTAVGQ